MPGLGRGWERDEELRIVVRFSGRSRHDDDNEPVRALPTPVLGMLSLLRSVRALPRGQRVCCTHLTVLLNGPADNAKVRAWFLQRVPVWLGGVDVRVDSVPTGNMQSWLAQMERVAWRQPAPPTSAAGGQLQWERPPSDRAVLFFVEEDYLHAEAAVLAVLRFFGAYEPCVVVPYDSPEQYSPATRGNLAKFGPTYHRAAVLQGGSPNNGGSGGAAGDEAGGGDLRDAQQLPHHWRSTTMATVTWAARAGLLRELRRCCSKKDSLKDVLPQPLNDFANARALAERLGVWSPLPSLSCHIHRNNPALCAASFDRRGVEAAAARDAATLRFPVHSLSPLQNRSNRV